MPDDAN
jgi:hypothetical protein